MKFSEYENKKNESENAEYQKNKSVKETYDMLKNKSKSEISSMLMEEVQRQKNNGTFDKKSLLNSLQLFAGYISDEQLSDIKRIISNL